MDDAFFYGLLDRFGYSGPGYRKVRRGVKKRVARHMQAHGCRTATAYLDLLERDREALLAFHRRMTVSISRLFRDQMLWQTLQDTLLPQLAGRITGPVRAWSAGCARGEEAYSLNMAWKMLTPSLPAPSHLEITATDMNPGYIRMARKGIYDQRSLKDAPEAIISRCFEPKQADQSFAVKPEYRTNIRWQVHNLLSDPPPGPYDLIFLRNNLLTYYVDSLKKPAFRHIVNALAPSGFLILGAHEQRPEKTGNLKRTAGLRYVFQKVP